ncbi:hypothetical protein ACGC1H_000199 [Rhizoctonia solani]|uniref:Uncharacterized protein n=1 Tax=Rhizoctonia solani TaxID=456999 RepID=A0A8H3B835_9AGAM|nr:unnamed protein product [Rhizoctonia solani]
MVLEGEQERILPDGGEISESDKSMMSFTSRPGTDTILRRHIASPPPLFHRSIPKKHGARPRVAGALPGQAPVLIFRTVIEEALAVEVPAPVASEPSRPALPSPVLVNHVLMDILPRNDGPGLSSAFWISHSLSNQASPTRSQLQQSLTITRQEDEPSVIGASPEPRGAQVPAPPYLTRRTALYPETLSPTLARLADLQRS